ncbi:hypothetical protein [Chitinophaga nivalis]|uniref:Uncharacterized protein n=1 Tax=Chitinophaga nivalis TaxID=2991709 RepID=A0ABT3IRP4_9BACT|nr:hypothetical protein [Chitinophaga nivalis]MCW3463926.1 hypothetical protein [Chitinophaga nivalis]MCW3486384.1 hypothetical protein [Chitinophaga nivalis]
MNIVKIQEIIPDTGNKILTATLAAADECVALMDSGEVVRYKGSGPGEHLFSTKSSLGYQDGGFDMTAPSTIYTLDNIVVIVNDYKRHGYIHYPGKYAAIHLWREDYYAEISRYAIALYKDAQGIPHIIYAVAWNHVQIMNLDTLQVLTAAKSLITVDAEERHIAFYENYKEPNRLPWPSAYDYFFGGLLMSPDRTHFLSAGWRWGSSDSYSIYEIDHFIHHHRISEKNVSHWEHNNRAVCWIDATTVAVTFHPVKDDDEGAIPDAPCEVYFYQVGGATPELERKIKIPDVDILTGEMHYIPALQAILFFGAASGVTLFSLEGAVLLRDAALQADAYYPDSHLLLKVIDGKIIVFQLQL